MRDLLATLTPDRCFDERSVSEVVGYVLVFGLVITSIGLITFGGVDALEDTRKSERAANAERAFDVVAENMASIYDRNSPSRATEIDLSGAELYYDDPITVNVTVDGTHYVRDDIRPIVLRISNDRRLVYEAGAMFRDQREGGFTLRRAPFILKENRVHTPIIRTTAENVEAASGTTVLLRGQSTNRSVIHAPQTGDDSVHINITSPRYDLWETQLEGFPAIEEGDCETDADGEWVECEVGVTDPTVYVTGQEIDLSIVL